MTFDDATETAIGSFAREFGKTREEAIATLVGDRLMSLGYLPVEWEETLFDQSAGRPGY